MIKNHASVPLLSVLLLTACVTINIYFPAAAAEEVADEIIQGIQNEPAAGQKPEKTSRFESPVSNLALLESLFEFILPSAHAAEQNLDIDTPEIRQLRASMKNRYASLLPYYTKGYIGLQNNGLLVVKNAAGIPLQERNAVNKLVAAENNDRNRLYHAIANANGHPEWYEQIKTTFAERWISNAHAGWWYQDAGGAWKQK